MDAKHTPGPWAADIAHEQHRAVVRHGMTPIAEMWMTGQPMAEREANARLIAAAPKMLDALRSYVELGHSDTAMREARAAIAKATGEGK